MVIKSSIYSRFPRSEMRSVREYGPFGPSRWNFPYFLIKKSCAFTPEAELLRATSKET